MGVAVGVLQLRAVGRERREPAEGRNVLVEFATMQPALEAVSEQRAEGLPLPYAVEQPERKAHSFRREVNGKSPSALHLPVREVAAAEDGRGRGLSQRRGMNESSRGARLTRGRAQVFDPAVAAQVDAFLGGKLLHPPRRERGDPGVEAVRA